MTPDQRAHNRFFALVEADLRLPHVLFDRWQLEEFCRSMAPLAFEDDNWAWLAGAGEAADAGAVPTGGGLRRGHGAARLRG
jgi:hypothetical protein